VKMLLGGGSGGTLGVTLPPLVTLTVSTSQPTGGSGGNFVRENRRL
jgi:hypothetical protein